MLRFSHRLLFIFPHILITIAQINRIGHFCTNPNVTYTPNSTYQTNLNTAISILTSNTNITYGFYNFSYGQSPDVVQTIALCRGDIDLDTCHNCLARCAQNLIQMCNTYQKEAYGWYDVCMFRYSNQHIYHLWDTSVPGYVGTDQNNATQPDQYQLAVGKLLEKVAPIASNGDSMSKFATGSAPGTGNDTIYMLVQCTPDITAQNCNDCLAGAASELRGYSYGKSGAWLFKASCTFRYTNTLFYGVTPPPGAPTLSGAGAPLPPAPSPHPPPGTNILEIVGIAVAAIVVIGFIIWLICIFIKKPKEKLHDEMVIKEKFHATEYEPKEIEDATDSFSDMLGRGAFGAVFKGKLKDGPIIAVKKLIRDCTQDEQDLKNEIKLLAKLAHKNLVRLLGFSRYETRILLIYEFVQNASLESFINGNAERTNFDWNTLSKIIDGIAEGLAYLHIGSQLQIIHRDLKPANILLDVNMNPKIADFGTARVLTLDATHSITQNVIGTYGYIAPEYFNLFQYSMKTDVYSFGVIVLEIISGQKINRPSQPNDNLTSFAWRNWQADTLSNVINGALRTDSSSLNRIRRCIQIGLLCVQESAADRPTMNLVYQWLTNHYIRLDEPNKPACFVNPDQPHAPLPMLDEYESIQSSMIRMEIPLYPLPKKE